MFCLSFSKKDSVIFQQFLGLNVKMSYFPLCIKFDYNIQYGIRYGNTSGIKLINIAIHLCNSVADPGGPWPPPPPLAKKKKRRETKEGKKKKGERY